jgi:hypothetical protein
MSKRKRVTTARTIERFKKEGRGQGEGSNYKPTLKIQDVPSHGRRHRVWGIKTGRIHHYMSDLELSYHYVLEAAPDVIDIREQYGLDLALTQQIAQKMRLKHPVDPKTRHPIIMTTDFLITVRRDDGRIEYKGRTVKPSYSGLSKRACEKLEIERLYYQMQRIDWGIVTEREIPRAIAQNTMFLTPYQQAERYGLSAETIQAVAQTLRPHLVTDQTPLRKLTAWCDEQLQLTRNQSLTVVYHLIATGQWPINLSEPIDTAKPLRLLCDRSE